MTQPGTVEPFDMISALLDAGVPHIPQQILCYLDSRSLLMSEMVSTIWKDFIGEFPIWKLLVQQKSKNSQLWKGLFERRGWHMYLEAPLSKLMPNHFFRHLHQSAYKDIQSLEANWRSGHYTLTRVQTGNIVMCLQFDDNKLVTGHGVPHYAIMIWDRRPPRLQYVKALQGHWGSIWCLQYNEDMVISGSADYSVKVWDIRKGEMINDLLHHKDMVCSLKFTTNTLVTGSCDKTVAVWSIKSPTDITLRMTLTGHEEAVWALDLSETSIISGSRDKTIKVWDSSTGELIQTLNGHTDWVRCLQLQGSHLISGSHDQTLRIWNFATGECIQVLHGHNGCVACVAVGKKRIVSGSDDEDLTLKVWDLTAALDAGSSSDALLFTTAKEHTDWIGGVKFDDFQVISCSDRTLFVYDFLDPTPPSLGARPLNGPFGEVWFPHHTLRLPS